MIRGRRIALLGVLILILFSSGCAKWMGNLRRDLDDSDPYDTGPTVGGRWSEKGFLAQDEASSGLEQYDSVGHAERNPASAGMGGPSRGSWVTADDRDANRRDQARGLDSEDDPYASAQAYSNNPEMPPQTRRLYKNGDRATRDDFIDESGSEGSLWASDGQTNYYFTKNKVRGVGDIITVNAENELVRDAATELRRTLSESEREMELTAAQERIRAKALGLPDPEAAAQAKAQNGATVSNGKKTVNYAAPDEDTYVSMPKATLNDIEPGKAMELKQGDTILAEIVDRYPNGNYKIRGTKKVRYRNGFRLLTLLGVVKGSDISEDDVVSSGKLYEYRLEMLRN